MLNLNHKQLDVWQVSKDFIIDIYSLTEKFPKSEIFGLTNHIRRSSISVISNIAEGSSRKSFLDRKRFYEIARSSLVELDTQLEISISLKYCSETDIKIISEKMNHIFAMLSKLIEKTK
jgi:four helix bundle protein